MARTVNVIKEIKEFKENINVGDDEIDAMDLLSKQRHGLVDREKLVDKQLERLKSSHTKSYHQKYEMEDLETDRRNILKEIDDVDKLIRIEFSSGARAMRWKMQCVGPLMKVTQITPDVSGCMPLM